jgi:hypothetical protein
MSNISIPGEKGFQVKHGMSGTPIYRRWKGMRSRCNNPNAVNYERYGGRGIDVCDRWRDFTNFYSDMGEPEPGLTIERIDNDGDYTPENCTWVTPKMQMQNTRVPKPRKGHLNSEAVKAIRFLYPSNTQQKLADAYGVCRGNVWNALQ